MGIDPSLQSTGYAFRHHDGRVDLGTIRSGELRGPRRLVHMRDKLEALLDRLRPTHVFYEDYAMGGKGRVHHIGELGGIFKTLMYERGITVTTIAPTLLKKLIAGTGGADKPAMRAAIRTRYGLDIPNNDMADAFALLVVSEHFYKVSAPPSHIGKSAQAFNELGKRVDTTIGARLQTIAK